MAKPLGFIGSVARLGDVQLDAVTSISQPTSWERTTTALEQGAPITRHRQRNAQAMSIEVTITDAEPFFGAFVVGLWEIDHARKVRDRIRDLQVSGEEVTFFDGREFRRSPEGQRVWVVDEIDDTTEPGKDGEWTARVTLGESRRVATLFSSALPNVDPALADEVGGVTDAGRQSGTTADAATTSAVIGGLA